MRPWAVFAATPLLKGRRAREATSLPRPHRTIARTTFDGSGEYQEPGSRACFVGHARAACPAPLPGKIPLGVQVAGFGGRADLVRCCLSIENMKVGLLAFQVELLQLGVRGGRTRQLQGLCEPFVCSLGHTLA